MPLQHREASIRADQKTTHLTRQVLCSKGWASKQATPPLTHNPRSHANVPTLCFHSAHEIEQTNTGRGWACVSNKWAGTEGTPCALFVAFALPLVSAIFSLHPSSAPHTVRNAVPQDWRLCGVGYSYCVHDVRVLFCFPTNNINKNKV